MWDSDRVLGQLLPALAPIALSGKQREVKVA